MLEKLTDNHIRVAVVGNVDAGNSTFIGTQVSGQLDNGRGSSRSSIMKHKHELESGRTSTVGTHLVCLDKNAQPLIAPSKTTKEGDLVQEATKVVSFIDLGHEKYLKTTIAGISRGMADYAFLLVNGTQPPNHMTLHHLKLCVALNIPVIVVMTKANRVAGEILQKTKRQIQKFLRDSSIGLRPFTVNKSKILTLLWARRLIWSSRPPFQCLV